MPSVIPFDEDNFLPAVDALIATWKDCTAPIFVQDISPVGLPTGNSLLLGTGFFATYRQVAFFVTAAHVLKGLDSKRLLGTHVKGQGILLSGLPFFLCHEHDLAIALLEPDWLDNTGLPSVHGVVLDEVWEGYDSLDRWITVGYPGSKNGIFPKLNRRAINTHGTSFDEIIQKPTARAHISNPLGFRFDKKKSVDSTNRRANPPCFSGTSGSPIWEVIARVDGSGNVSLRCRLQGVLLGWHKKEKEVIAARVEGLVSLIEELLAILRG